MKGVIPLDERLTYKPGLSRTDTTNLTKAAVIPILVCFLVLFVISQFGAFGRNIIALATAIMWLAGTAVAIKIPSQRKSTLKGAYVAISGYVSALYLDRMLIGFAATTSSEQLMASFGEAMPVSTGTTIAGYLQSMLWLLAFIGPIGYLTMMGKTFVTFRRTAAKNKVIEQIRGMSHSQTK